MIICVQKKGIRYIFIFKAKTDRNQIIRYTKIPNQVALAYTLHGQNTAQHPIGKPKARHSSW